MVYYAFIKDNKIDSCGECPQLTEGVLNIEISEEIYNNIDHYIWDGTELIEDPDYEEKQAEKERQRINMLSLTKREVFLALYRDKGVTPEQIKAQISNPEALIEFEYASEYFRGNPLIDAIGSSLGYTSEQLDYLFINREFEE